MAEIILFNKPYGVLCQFTAVTGRQTLADYIDAPGFYAAGRLDNDSEGLLILTDDGKLQSIITSPEHKIPKVYLVQIEGAPTDADLNPLRAGVLLKDGISRPAECQLVAEPPWLWPRVPPIRERQKIPTSWLQITISEGKNRQVRRMTAAIGYPTLRLVRVGIGDWDLSGLENGKYVKARLTAWPQA